MEVANIYANDYQNYWDDGNQAVIVYIYEMHEGYPMHYHIGKKTYVQKGLDSNWRGYINGTLVAYDTEDNCNRVLIRTRNKYAKRASNA